MISSSTLYREYGYRVYGELSKQNAFGDNNWAFVYIKLSFKGALLCTMTKISVDESKQRLLVNYRFTLSLLPFYSIARTFKMIVKIQMKMIKRDNDRRATVHKNITTASVEGNSRNWKKINFSLF